jgi:hypothetical protein
MIPSPPPREKQNHNTPPVASDFFQQPASVAFRRQEHDRDSQVLSRLPNYACKLDPVGDRHLHVHKDEIRKSRLHRIERFDRIGDNDRLHPGGAKYRRSSQADNSLTTSGRVRIALTSARAAARRKENDASEVMRIFGLFGRIDAHSSSGASTASLTIAAVNRSLPDVRLVLSISVPRITA